MARTKLQEKQQADKAAAAEAKAAEKAAGETKAEVPSVPSVPKVPKVPRIVLAEGRVPTVPENEREEEMIAQMEKDPNVQVSAVYNRMRNPYTGAVFTKGKPTDVVGLDSDENAWTRKQIFAGVLMLCPDLSDAVEDEDEDALSEGTTSDEA